MSWAAVVNDKPVYQEALAATLAKGHRLSTVITLELDPATAGDPRTARVRSGSASPLKPFTGPLPGTILLSPTELEAARR